MTLCGLLDYKNYVLAVLDGGKDLKKKKVIT
jgi:hypothetical protein